MSVSGGQSRFVSKMSIWVVSLVSYIGWYQLQLAFVSIEFWGNF